MSYWRIKKYKTKKERDEKVQRLKEDFLIRILGERKITYKEKTTNK